MYLYKLAISTIDNMYNVCMYVRVHITHELRLHNHIKREPSEEMNWVSSELHAQIVWLCRKSK